MDFLKIIGALLLGVLLLTIWYGFLTILSMVLYKHKIKVLNRFVPFLVAVIPTVIILILNEDYLINFKNIDNWTCWLIILGTVLVSTIIVLFVKSAKKINPKGIFLAGFDGVLMEVPQRMMMQSFIVYLLSLWNVDIYHAIWINAIIWCTGIVVQSIITKAGFLNKKFFCEIVASCLFSLGVGYVLLETGLILFTMVAHFFERVLSISLRNSIYHKTEIAE